MIYIYVKYNQVYDGGTPFPSQFIFLHSHVTLTRIMPDYTQTVSFFAFFPSLISVIDSRQNISSLQLTTIV